METQKQYRPNVAAVILSATYPFKCEFFIACRTDIADAWQFPQGGVDEGETPREALFRELKEEIGTSDVEIIGEYPHWLEYDFPQKIAQKMYPFDGQSQKYFLVRLKKDAKINIHTKEPEFCEFKFVTLEKIFDHVTYFKRPVYKQVLHYFKKEGYF